MFFENLFFCLNDVGAFWVDFRIIRDFLRRLGPFSPQKKPLGAALGLKWPTPSYFPSTV